MQTTIEITRIGHEPPRLRLDLRCAGCGYGVVVVQAPERCPMCQGVAWVPEPRSALTSFARSRLT
jgi:rubrerythrin